MPCARSQTAARPTHIYPEGAAVLNWRLYLPESWTEDEQRRGEAGIPQEVKCQKKWELALEMISGAHGYSASIKSMGFTNKWAGTRITFIPKKFWLIISRSLFLERRTFRHLKH
jgi:hypothetical protein